MNKKLLLTITIAVALISGSNFANAQGVSINGTNAAADPSAMLDVGSTTQGMLVPRMTAAQRLAINSGSPATGLLVYQTDGVAGFYFYNGTAWVSLSTTTGTVTSVGTASPLTGGTISGSGTIGISQSTIGTDGYLSSIDWNTFNGKQAAGNYITALTGDVAASGPGSATATIGANKVNYSKMQQASTLTLLGNPTGATANVQEITLGTGLSFSSGQLVSSGGAAVANLGAQKVTLSAQNGVATTAMRSDAAPALDQTIAPTWSGLHTFTGGITSTGTTAISISGDATNTTVGVGNGGGVKAVTLGSTTSTSGTTVQSGTTGISVAATNGPVTMTSGTGNLNISNDATNTTVGIGTGGGVKAVTLGSTTGTSGTAIQSGSTGVNVNVSNNQPTNINTGSSTGNVSIGNNSVVLLTESAGTANINASTGANTVTSIGTGSTTGKVSIGNAAGGTFLPQFNTAVVASSVLTVNNNTGQITTGVGILVGVKYLIATATNGTFDVGTTSIVVELVGGGGGGGGSAKNSGANTAGGGGGSGAYCKAFVTGLTASSTYTVTIGAGGTGGSGSTGTVGLAGTATSFLVGSPGATFTANPGQGGGASIAAAAGGGSTFNTPGGAGGTSAGTGTVNILGNVGAVGIASDAGNFAAGGAGASSFFGGGAPINWTPNTQSAGTNGVINTGAGGSGGSGWGNNTAASGGNGGTGLVIVYEYR